MTHYRISQEGVLRMKQRGGYTTHSQTLILYVERYNFRSSLFNYFDLGNWKVIRLI